MAFLDCGVMTARDYNAVHGDETDGNRSFYFFDLDDNMLLLPTTVILTDVRTGEKRDVSTGDFPQIEPLLGKPGEWAEWKIGDDAFANFEDHPPAESPFLSDIRKALSEGGDDWRGPSWKFFSYACEMQRDVVFITARGHAPETLAAGMRLLAEKGEICRPPNIMASYPVGNPAVKKALGGEDQTTPLLKLAAIDDAVATALRLHGEAPPHRFGMSDDDPLNVQSVLLAMHTCKMKYEDKRFFVINTHFDQHMKLEVLNMNQPAPSAPVGQSTRERTQNAHT